MPQFEQLRHWIETETGMDFSGSRLARLRDAFHRTSPAGIDAEDRDLSPELFAAPFLERLTAALTVGESFFFRNEFHFRALREHVIPAILAENAEKREIRVWSAGCATGEEPYSLAILLDQLLGAPGQHASGQATPHGGGDVPNPWTVSILGTDLNPEFLARAREARYRPWSFRRTEIHEDPRYFNREGDSRRLVPRLVDRVRFAYLNLVKDVYPSPLTGTLGMDLILFRNVAIYLRPAVTAAIIERLRESLRPGGWLLLGESEVGLAPSAGFEVQRFDQATFFRKAGDGPALLPQAAAPVAPSVAPWRAVRLSTPAALPDWTPLPDPALDPPTPGSGSSAAALEPSHSATPTTSESSVWQRVESLLAHSDDAAIDRELDRIHDRNERAAVRLRCARRLLGDAETSRARRMLEASLREQPLAIEGHLLRACLAEEIGDLATAEQSYRRALYIDRLCPMAHFHLALLLQRSGDAAGAERSLRSTLKLIEKHDPRGAVEFGEGVCYGRLAEMVAAILRG